MLHISLTAGLIAAATLAGSALAQTNPDRPACHYDKLLNSNGLMLRMGSGQVFQAYPGSGGKIASWLPLDKVKLCPLGGSAYQMTDLSNNQQIKALRQQ